MIMARNEDGTYSQVGFVKDNVGIDTEYIYDKDGDIVFEKGFTRETSGTVPLTINGIGKDLKDWSITGNTVQNGTPTPENPVEVQAVGDRTANLFDKNTITAGNFATVSGTVANNAYYCSDFIPITATTYYFQNVVGGSYQNTVVVYDANKQGLRYAKLSGSNKVSGAIAFQSGDAYIRINCYYQTDVDTVMVNIGSTALPYEPYGYKIPVVTRGKNLWYLQSSYSFTTYYNINVNIKAGHYLSYIIETNGTTGSQGETGCQLTFSDNTTQYFLFNANYRTSIFLSKDVKIVKVYAGKDYNTSVGFTATVSKIMVSANADDSYEPYHEPITTPIYLPTPLYSGEVLRSDGSREVKWRKLVLTGKENVVKNNNDSTNYLYYIPMTDNKKINGFCSHLIGRSGAPISIIGFNMISTFPVLYLNFGADIMKAQSSGNTVTGFKEYLATQHAAGTPVTVWYQLATPTTETFTAPQIPTLNGTTVIDVDTAVKPTEMYTKYKSSK